MTILNALNNLKNLGITRLVGMSDTTDINAYIDNAEKNHANAVKYAPELSTWQHALKLNLRPRKCLGWRTPYEVFFAGCCT